MGRPSQCGVCGCFESCLAPGAVGCASDAEIKEDNRRMREQRNNPGGAGSGEPPPVEAIKDAPRQVHPPVPVETDVQQVLVHPALWPAFDAWLASRGLTLTRLSAGTEDDLPTWLIEIGLPAGRKYADG